MGYVIYFFGSGLAFFVGAGCVLGVLALSLSRWQIWVRASAMVVIFGLILVVLSGTPLPIWFYTVAIFLTGAWLIAARFGSTISLRRRVGLSALTVLVWLGGTIFELPYHMLPNVTAAGCPRLYLFGDSVSAGVSDHDTNTWPRLLAHAHSIEISDYSRAGATVAMALRRANEVTLGEGIVLLEIGGNDLLDSTTNEDFEHNLDQLLNRVCASGRDVLMFELPIPPLRNEYGRIQRRLAAQYHVLLIPKRIFIAVLTGQSATLDSIHLSRSGHERMAEAVWHIIEPAYAR